MMHCLSSGCSAASHNDGALSTCNSNMYWWCSHVVVFPRHVYFVGAPLSGVPVMLVGLSAQRLMLSEDFHIYLAPLCTCISGCPKFVLAIVACAGSVDALLGCSNSHNCLSALAVRLLGSADSRTPSTRCPMSSARVCWSSYSFADSEKDKLGRCSSSLGVEAGR